MRRLRYPILAITLLLLGLFFVSFVPTPHERVDEVDVPLPELGYDVTVNFDYPVRLGLGTSDSLNLSTRIEAATEAAHSLPADARFEVTLESLCLRFDPPGDSVQAIVPGTTQRWRWELISMEPSGSCDLMLVIGLHLPDRADRQIIYVRKLTIDTMSVVGLPVTTVRGIGLVGSIIGLVILAFVQYASRPKPS